ncbi:hypothetical protein AMECASPLE_029534 [Ameca splendens]|uniref:Uncharacterized protein n=1 Tax=Ameca splendens TaxID=208324 RepID=A0ABV0YGW8_9TELE
MHTTTTHINTTSELVEVGLGSFHTPVCGLPSGVRGRERARLSGWDLGWGWLAGCAWPGSAGLPGYPAGACFPLMNWGCCHGPDGWALCLGGIGAVGQRVV